MKLITTLVCYCGFAGILSAQDIVGSAAKSPDFNQFGDPVTNIIDPNGARQGDWFFLNTEGQEVVLQRYTDHVCQEVSVATESAGGVTWVPVSELLTSGPEVEEIRTTVQTVLTEYRIEREGVRQLFVLAGDGQPAQVSFLGDWNGTDLNSLRKSIRSSLKKMTTTNRQIAYVYFE